MGNENVPSCANCGFAACSKGIAEKYPPHCLTVGANRKKLAESVKTYRVDPLVHEIAMTAAAIEGEFYGEMNRVEETLEFIKRQRYGLVGIATCVGLLGEARIFSKLMRERGINHYAVGCKIGAVDKVRIGIDPKLKINGGCGHESICNPIMQAKILNEKKTDFNVMMGLCVGHDSLFLKFADAPTTVLVVKDRVMAHNPVGALYTAEAGFSPFKRSQTANK
jgi:uncharacterized metal-binding protein